MSIIVQKFGGSSVKNKERMTNAAQIIASAARDGAQVVAVVSAQGDTTDELILKAHDINPDASPREMDALLSAGEQISSALLAMAVQKLGHRAVALTGWQAGFKTDGSFGSARIANLDPQNVKAMLDDGYIVIVAGFQGVFGNNITTLGRGGSDTSAVALAAALSASVCRIYTDVDGIYTADPRIVKGARHLEAITYDEMLELASLGANVMHNRAIEMAKKFNVPLEVCSSINQNPGTVIKEKCPMEEIMIRGAAVDSSSTRIAIVGVPDVPGVACQVFSLLAEHNIGTDIILQSFSRDNTQDITFTVSDNMADRAMALLEPLKAELGARDLQREDDVAKISIVGAGVMENPQVAAKMFGALRDASINIKMISTSEIKISVIVANSDAHKALSAVHSAFFGGDAQ